jgi:phenylacetate-CoA ligase
MYRWLVPHVVFPLAERITGRRVWSEALRLRELQWRTGEELQARALARLRVVLRHAVDHVPYYRRLLGEAGVAPDSIRSLDDLARIPLTSKRALRAAFPDDALADDVPESRRVPMRTSGSSGTPLVFYADRAGLDPWLGSFIFFQEWAGAAVWDPRLRITGPVREASDYADLSPLANRLRTLLLGERVVVLDAVTSFDLALVRSTLRRLSRHGRVVLRGYPSTVARVGAGVLGEGHELPAYPKVAITSGEALTEGDAAVIRRAFRCPVVNHYSTWEAPHLAQTCPDNPQLFHVNSERVIVRVVDRDGRNAPLGEEGRVVITHLSNDVMPLINYELGDWAAPGPACPCGRGFPTIQGLVGRTVETIRTPSGRVFSPASLTYVVSTSRMHPYVLEYQAVQPSVDRLILRIVPSERWDTAAERLLRENAEGLLGPDIALEIRLVERIELEPSGKRLMIKSELPRADRTA